MIPILTNPTIDLHPPLALSSLINKYVIALATTIKQWNDFIIATVTGFTELNSNVKRANIMEEKSF